MIPEDEFGALMTGDPLVRFARIERLARAHRREAVEKTAPEHEYEQHDTDSIDHDYASVVLAAAEACGVSELLDFKPPARDDKDSWKKYVAFRDLAQRVSDRLLIGQLHARSDGFYSVAFDAPTKVKLRHHLEKMRSIIDESDESPEKKHVLFARIAELAEEIDKDRTRFEHLTALTIQLAQTTGVVAEKLEPMVRTIQNIFGKSKAQENQRATLPAPRKRKQIEGPKESNRPHSFERDLDDEIPF
jgi:hypothetical protein